jgi:hypothetical protein
MTYNWENEKPLVTTGSLLKVKMPSEFVLPRETAENIFYVDGRIAARAKVIDDQTLVLIVPQEIRSKNSILMIGEPGLPETISTSQRESFFQMGINGTASVPKISISPNNIVELQLENEEELYSQQF